MPLPSGTTISADDINTHLGKASGQPVDWNVIVRTLSNNNSTPNLGDARGRSARHLQNTTNPSADMYSDYNYGANTMYTAAFSIPNSPWRVIISTTYPTGTSQQVINLTVVGTHHDTKYTYTWKPSNNSLGTLGGSTVYFTNGLTYTMLDNGKLVIFGTVGTDWNQSRGDKGIGFLVITFDSSGQINSCNSYLSQLSNIYSTSYVYHSGEGLPLESAMSKYGNKFVVAISRYFNGVVGILVHVDLSSTVPVFKYAKIGDPNSDTSDATGATSGCSYSAVYVNDTTVSVFRNVNAFYATTYTTMMCKTDPTASSISWTSTANKWTANASSALIETNDMSPYTTYSFGLGTGNTNYTMPYVDKRNYYYRIDSHSNDASGYQISPYKYYTGTFSSIIVQKIDPSSNTTLSKFIIGGRDYYWAEYYTDKGGSGYHYYGSTMLHCFSVKAIETDASGNTYILYKTQHHGNGGYRTSPPTNITSIGTGATTQQVLYHISKYNSSGVFQWNRVLDLGSRTSARCPYYTYVASGQDLLSAGVDKWALITRDDIGVLEIYVQAALNNPSTTTYWALNSSKVNLRSAHILMSSGDSVTFSTGYQDNLCAYSDITDADTAITQAQLTTTTTATITFPRHGRTTSSYNNSVANSSVFSNSAGWYSESLSATIWSTSIFTSNATTYTLGYSTSKYGDK